MTQNILQGNVISCQIFKSGLYVVKVGVVVYSLLAYNIIFFKLFSTYFLVHEYSSQT